MTVNLGRICREVEICRWGRGSIDSQLGKDLQRLKFVDGEGGREGGVDQQSTWEGSAERLKFVGENGEEGVNQQSTWEGSTKTLEGLPLTILILGGQSTVNLGRICKGFGRITSDNLDLGWGQSTVNLEGSTMTWKDYL